MSNFPTLTSLIQPPVDSRWLWAVRIPSLTLTLPLGGFVIWILLGTDAGWESALMFVPYLAALGWALWSMRSNPPGKFGVALAAGLGLVVSLILSLAAISSTFSFIAAWKHYRISEPVWGALAGVEAVLALSAAFAFRGLRRGETAGAWFWAVRVLAVAGVVLVILAFNGYFQQARRFDTWLAPLERVLVLLGAGLLAVVALWFLRSQANAQWTETRRVLILMLISSPVLSVLFVLWSVSAIYDTRSSYGQASPAYGLLWWPPALLFGGYTVSATKVFFLLKREGGDVWRLVGASSLAVAVIVTSAALFPRGHRGLATQAAAVGAMRTINTQEINYASTYEGSFSPSLTELGPPPPGQSPTASAAGLIDDVLARGVKNAYRFTYTPGARDAKGLIVSYTLTARPLKYTSRTRPSYFTDESGVVRFTQEDRDATAQDPPLE